MQYKGNDLQILKEHILLIISELKRVCDKYKIQYFIIGGSALGAVRHKGFIPWDDDFDIGMTRDNYEHFLKVAPMELSSNYFLQCYETDPNTPFYFAKIRMNDTLFVEGYCHNIPMHQGIYIDIFPYDNLPETLFERKKQLRKVLLYSELFITKSTSGLFFSEKKDLLFFCKKLFRIILHFILMPVSKDFLFKLLDKENRRYNSHDTSEVSYIKYPFLKIKKKNVEECNSILFEGIYVSCCKNIEEYLKSHFGKDYMQLPPLEKRVNHRPVKLSFLHNK